jgi:hypothetical protein
VNLKVLVDYANAKFRVVKILAVSNRLQAVAIGPGVFWGSRLIAI